MWALGVVLYVLLTGSLPFNDGFLPRLQLSIMNGRFDTARLQEFPAATEVVQGLLQVNPEDRWNMVRVMQHPWVRAGKSIQ